MYQAIFIGILALAGVEDRGAKDAASGKSDTVHATSTRCTDGDETFTLPSISGRQIVSENGSLFTIRGFGYSPTPICQYPGGDPFDTFSDPQLARRDAPWIRYAGGNVVRIYGALYTDGTENWSINTTRAYLREFEKRGIWVVMGTEIQPQGCLSGPDNCDNVIQAHVDLVREFHDAPNILMWAPGNEVNSHINTAKVELWYALLDDIAAAIKAEQGGVGPGVGPYVCGILGEYDNTETAELALHGLDTRAPNVDIWAVNVYRGSCLGTLFQQILAATNKPFWVAETGIDSFDHELMEEDEFSQANYAKALWLQVEKHCDVVCGADIAFYSDEWWKYSVAWNPPIDPDPCTQVSGGGEFGCGPDNVMDEEYLGAMRIAEGCDTVNDVSPKLAYYAIKHLWTDPPQACELQPVLADFNAPDCNGRFCNNYAGTAFPVGSVNIEPAAGISGCPGDWALNLRGQLPQVPRPALFVMTLFPETPRVKVVDLEPFDRVSFHARLGTPTAHDRWQVRLESGPGSAVCSWNITVPSTEFSSFCLEASECDLSKVAQIVFDTIDLPPGGLHEVDLDVDNLAIFDASSDGDNDCVPDKIDNCPDNPNADQRDSDGNCIADACDVHAVFEPPIANTGFVLKQGRTLPIKFHLEGGDGDIVAGERAVRLEVVGRAGDGKEATYAFDRGDGSLRCDDSGNPSHFMAALHTRRCPLTPDEEYTCTALQDGIPIGSIVFTAYATMTQRSPFVTSSPNARIHQK